MFVNPLSKEAVLITLYNNISDDQFKFNNSWEQSARPKDIKGGGGIAATAEWWIYSPWLMVRNQVKAHCLMTR